jgi:patatin-related protein
LLGYALANGKDFSTTKELWRRDGDIGLLLNGPEATPETSHSLLNSDEFYRRQLAQAFANLDAKDFRDPECELSRFDEMDVFITGTSFEPDVYTTFDDRGRAIEMQDYRKVFKLKHRATRRNRGAFMVSDLTPSEKMAPVLRQEDWSALSDSDRKRFRPYSRPENQDRNGYEKTVDATLTEWGALTRSAYFLDGGILDNKPFSPTIKAIFGRTADRPVDRMLFYVEPDPEVSLHAQEMPCQPNFLSAVFNGVVGISTYQSTTDDARELEEHNSQVVRHTPSVRDLRTSWQLVGDGCRRASRSPGTTAFLVRQHA